MKKANLSCPREVVFVNGRMVYTPVIPQENTQPSSNVLEIEVNILGVEGEKALILLPEILREGEQNTAIVKVQHLD
jgi:hypothetical protein